VVVCVVVVDWGLVGGLAQRTPADPTVAIAMRRTRILLRNMPW
jgi:hypothetical protein